MVTNFENNLCSRMCMILILEDINAKNCSYVDIIMYFNPNDVVYTLYTLFIQMQSLALAIYRKQQNLHRRKPSRFLWVFDEMRKFSLLILQMAF